MHDSVVRSLPPWVELIQPSCGPRACLARQVIWRSMEHFSAPTQGQPRVSHDCFSRPELALGESWLLLSPRASFGRVVTTSHVQAWPHVRWNSVSHPSLARARWNNISHPRLASSDTKLCLPPRAGLGQDRTASLIRGWPRARPNYVSHLELASEETELHLPSEVGLGRDGIVSPA
jgi:hypothetical protein